MSPWLSVAIGDDTAMRDVTDAVTDLSFSKTAPGGHRLLSCKVNLPLSRFPTLGPSDRVWVFDSATGDTVFDGYTNNPGKADTAEGESFDLTASGAMILAADQAERWIFRDTMPDNWEPDPVGGSGAATTKEAGTVPAGAGSRAGQPAVLMQYPRGYQVTTERPIMRYTKFQDSPMNYGAITFFRDDGLNSTDFHPRVGSLDPADTLGDALLVTFSYTSVYFDDMTTTGSVETHIAASAAGEQDLLCSIDAPSGFTVATDNAWSVIAELGVLGQPVDRYGDWYANPRATYVLASEVAEHLFGTVLAPHVDPAALDLITSSFHIESLVFLEPTTASGVFDALLSLEDYDWGIGSAGPGRKHRAWFRPWPTQVRYVLGDAESVELPGSDDSLVNRVTVTWANRRGVPKVTVVTADVPELTLRGRTKDADAISLPDGHGSESNAIQAGTLALAEKNRRAYSGTATVTRPIMDLITGQKVDPAHLEPGCLARIAGEDAVVRVTETNYVDNDRACTLTLNTPVPTAEEFLARSESRRRRW